MVYFFSMDMEVQEKHTFGKKLASSLRVDNKIVIMIASSGIASLLLPGGRTAYSKFKIPVPVFEDSTCNIHQGTQLAELLNQTWPFLEDLNLHYSGMLWSLTLESSANMLYGHGINSLWIMISPTAMKFPSITGALTKYGKLSSAARRIGTTRFSLCTLISLSFCLFSTICQLDSLFFIYLFDFEHWIYYKCLIYYLLHVNKHFFTKLLNLLYRQV